MKTTFFILLGVLFTVLSEAQELSCMDSAAKPTANCKIYSKIITNVNGTATYRLTVFANDTVFIDSLKFNSSYFNSFFSPQSFTTISFPADVSQV